MRVPRVCAQCRTKDGEIAELRDKSEQMLLALKELDKLCTLLTADLARIRGERAALEPNRSERLSGEELQLVFEGVVTALETAANDGGDGPTPNDVGADTASTESTPEHAPGTAGSMSGGPKSKSTKANAAAGAKKGHGRRPIDLSKLPVQDVVVEPAEVSANPDRYRFIGNECSERLARREASFIRIRLIRPKYKLIAERDDEESVPDLARSLVEREMDRKPATIVCAPIPSFLWPRVMADVSAVTHVILSKYDMCLPLHRQERALARCGFHISRSTQCDWLSAAYEQLYRIVDAMMTEACESAFCIATDATGAPVRMPGACVNWHLFVFIADEDHVIFRPTRAHTSAAIAGLLDGFGGNLLSDASLVYDVLHREHGVTEVSCWFHLRRYFWKARATEPKRAMEVLAIIAKLFKVARETAAIPMPDRTEERARRARPILEILDRWIDKERSSVDDRSPLAAAITYYDNQRTGLHAFLADGRLRLDNNISEQQLRHLVVGRHNWNFFENAGGLRWYAVFRSLIASCTLRGIDPERYLDEVLRLAPHWPTTRMLELAPKYWPTTRAALSTEQQDTIVPPWLRANEPPVVEVVEDAAAVTAA